MSRFSCLISGLLVLTMTAGCGDEVARIGMPPFQPKEIARAVLSELDGNGDSVLSASEFELSPGLNSSVSVFDGNGDGELSEDELVAEFQNWLNERTGLISLRCEVSHHGKPLAGATVRMIPEPFLEGVLPVAIGVTDAMGMTQISCEAEHLPKTLKSMRAMKPGVYRIEVTHPEVPLPAKYNMETTLGRSVSLHNSYPLVLNL